MTAPQELIDTDPSGPMWALTWLDGFTKLSVRAHEYSGPTEEDRGGVIGPLGLRNGLLPFYLLYLHILSISRHLIILL